MYAKKKHHQAPRKLSVRSAFTLIELVLVIGIISGALAFVVPAYRDYQIRNDLNIAAEHVSQALGRARILAQGGARSSAWGFSVSHRTLFAGGQYDGRDITGDELYYFPDTIETSGLDEVSFAASTGIPSATGTIILTSLRGERRTVNITIDRQGIAIDFSDRLTICHCSANPPHTLHLPESAWPAHRRHGDHLGPCQTPSICK